MMCGKCLTLHLAASTHAMNCSFSINGIGLSCRRAQCIVLAAFDMASAFSRFGMVSFCLSSSFGCLVAKEECHTPGGAWPSDLPPEYCWTWPFLSNLAATALAQASSSHKKTVLVNFFSLSYLFAGSVSSRTPKFLQYLKTLAFLMCHVFPCAIPSAREVHLPW